MQFFVDYKIALRKHDLFSGSGANNENYELEQFTVSEYPDDHIVKFVCISRIMSEKEID